MVAATFAWPAAAEADQRVHVDIRLADGVALGELIELGLEVELVLPDLGRVQGWIPAERLPQLRALEGVIAVETPRYALYASGSALSEGDEALGAAAARARFDVDGSGVRVAVISDGIRGLDTAQERGDAPELAEQRAFGSGSLARGAEGTAMLELVHDLAPGAELSFGAVATDVDMIAAVRYFAQRVDVIVDDVGFLYPDDQQSEVSRNTAAALANPEWPLRAYITAAGNWARTHWSGEFLAGIEGTEIGLPYPGPLHVWWRGGAINRFRLARDERVVIALHWDQPWGRATHDFDLYLLDQGGDVVASSERRQAIDSLDPQEVLVYTNRGAAARFGVVVQNWRGAAPSLRIELFVLGSSGEGSGATLEVATGASSLLAQSDAGGGAITVAAITQDVAGLDRVARYSSRGPTNNGITKPDIAAIDGVSISGATEFGTRFYGTSAAAPHVAAVAALVLEAQPSLLAADGGTAVVERQRLRELLLNTAVDIGPDGMDASSGAGRIDAEAAIAAARASLVVVNSAADRGPGSLREAIERVNAGEASLIAFVSDGGPREIVLESPLPSLERDGAVIDGAGWRLDARNVAVGLLTTGQDVVVAGLDVVGAADAGIVVRGEATRLAGTRLAGNGRGVLIEAGSVELDGVVAVANRDAGVIVGEGGAGRVLRSWIGIERDGTANGNGAAGIVVEAGAGALVVGAGEVARPAAPAAAPIAPLGLPELAPRSGDLHRVRGTVIIDGLPARAGTLLELWLDRRFAGSIPLGAEAEFDATFAGPGSAIRFSIGGVALEERLQFQPGGSSRVLLRTTGLAPAGDGEPSDGNRIAYNAGPAIALATVEQPATVRGNLIWANDGAWVERGRGLAAAPRILRLEFQRGGALLSGEAAGAAHVDLYGSIGAQPARYLATAAVSDDRFSFGALNLGERDRFWVLAHDERGGAVGASAGWAAASAPQIFDVSPDLGGYAGGDLITISGERLRVGSAPPRVFIGGAEALVRSADQTSLTVVAPETTWLGATDVAVLRSDGRVATMLDAYSYDTSRRVTLHRGWNAVTWLSESTRITAALAPVAAVVTLAFVWDATQQQWLAFSPEVPASLNTLRRLDRGDVLWLLVDAEDRLVWPQPLGTP